MGLSDACFEFLQATAEAAEVLAAAVHHYSAPDYPIPYGLEVDALRRACAAVKERPYDPTSGADLLRLAASAMTFHDTPPDAPERRHREVEMKKLILLLQANLDDNDWAAVPAVVANTVTETGFTPAGRFTSKDYAFKGRKTLIQSGERPAR